MKQIEIKNGARFRVLAWEDGEIVVEGQLTRIEDLLYIIQEYQKELPIKLKVDFSEWRGIHGFG